MRCSMMVVLALIASPTSVAWAQDANDQRKIAEEWWKFLEGEWSQEIPALNAKGTATWRLAADGHALIGRFKDEDGGTAVDLAGWDAHRNMLVVTGYGSRGNSWVMEFTKLSADVIEANIRGVLPDGGKLEGKFVGRRIDDDHYQWDFTGKIGDREDQKMTGKYERKRD